ncbi:FAD-binding protein [Streptomyces sp. INA 01156]
MWHYTEGIRNWDPIWPGHGIRILPDRPRCGSTPSAAGCRALPARLRHPGHARTPAYHRGHRRPRPLLVHPHPEDHREGVRAVGLRAEPRHHRQGPGRVPARTRAGQGRPRSGRRVPASGRGLRDRPDPGATRREDERPHRQAPARRGRRPPPDRGPRPADRQPLRQGRPGAGHPQRPPLHRRPPRPGGHPAPHPRPRGLPLIGVKLHILTRKTLGGIQTDLDSRALDGAGRPIEGLYAAGEVAGFGGGGVHGYNALEGTFLGGCLFSGRAAGRAAARPTA